jgi:hypothetical protein
MALHRTGALALSADRKVTLLCAFAVLLWLLAPIGARSAQAPGVPEEQNARLAEQAESWQRQLVEQVMPFW